MIRIDQWNITILYAFGPDARTQGAKKYEERVRLAVNAIMRTHTGRALLGTFRSGVPKDQAVWIMPYTNMDDYCNARTGDFLSMGIETGKANYEGVRIQYSPDRFEVDQCGWYPGMTAEQVLFHEMVHASRGLNDVQYDNTPLDIMDDYEEFLAVLITNMFRSELGAKKFHRDYIYKLLVEQREAELFLSSRAQYIEAIESLLDDQLVSAVKSLNTAYNPFRDFDRLKADHSDILEFINQLPGAQARETERLTAIGKKLTELRQMSVNSSSAALQAPGNNRY
jgi:Effector protein